MLIAIAQKDAETSDSTRERQDCEQRVLEASSKGKRSTGYTKGKCHVIVQEGRDRQAWITTLHYDPAGKNRQV